MAIKIAKKVKTTEGVLFAFADKAETKLDCRLKDLSQEMLMECAAHGIASKVGDSYSGADTVTEGIGSAKRVWDSLKAGLFNARGVGVSSLLAEAVARIKGIKIEEAQAALGSMTEENLEKLKSNDRVKTFMTVIRGERALLKAKTGSDEDVDFEV